MSTDTDLSLSPTAPASGPEWPSGSEMDEINIGRVIAEFFATLRRNWLVAAILFVLTIAGAVVLALVMPPYWRVEIVVMPVQESDPSALGSLVGALGPIAALGGFGSGGGMRSTESLAVLGSRDLFNGYAREKNLLPVLYSDDWDDEQEEWTVSPDRVPSLRQAYLLFDESIREIEEAPVTGIVTMSITWKDREQAVTWAREIIELTNRQLRERATADSMRNMEYLSEEMRTASSLGAQNALSSALADAYEEQLQNYMFARGQEEYAFRVIDPPTLPDEDERLWPPLIIVALGVLLGGLLAIFAAYTAALFRRSDRDVET
jgi:uncharacterized protein involved in exopolysaccharide biosynthesis